MFGITKTYNIGKAIANRVKGYTVWAKFPKVVLKRHPTTYIVCPDFSVAIPKTVTREASEASHIFTIKIVAKTRPVLRKVLDHMVACAREDIVVGDKRFECCRYKESTVKIGVHLADLKYTFRLRQLSYKELKTIKLTEEKNG